MNECPAPEARTVWPAAVALATARCSPLILLGRSIETGRQLCSFDQLLQRAMLKN